MCAYNQNIPQPTDALSQSQADLLANFQALKTLIDVNHGTFGAITEGKHEKVTFPAGVDPVVAAGDIALYSKDVAGTSQLFIKRGALAGVQFTDQGLAANPGWARLPSGILLKWGLTNMAAAGLNTYTFPVAATIPAFATIFSVMVSTAYTNPGDGDGFARVNSFLAPWTSFTVYGSQRTAVAPKQVSYTYLAIGI